MKRYTKPEIDIFYVQTENVMLTGTNQNSGGDENVFSKGGNNDFVFDDEDEDDSAEYAQTERQKWPHLLW